jgi:chemotaxis protein CheC
MILSGTQKDALAELIHIGYGRAAAALSAMTREQISLRAPQVDLRALPELRSLLTARLGERVACVNQSFFGPIAGHAMLLLSDTGARDLTRVLDQTAANTVLDGHAGDILTETGNVLLNACLGVFGNLLKVQLSFAVPDLRVDDTLRLLESVVTNHEPLTHAVVVQTQFSLRASKVDGSMLIVLGMASLDRLLVELARWELDG